MPRQINLFSSGCLLILFFIFSSFQLKAQNEHRPDSVKLYTTYTFTIIYAGELEDKNVKELETLFNGLPTIRYLNIDPKTKVLVVQVQDTPNYKKLVSSEIKQIILELGDYELRPEFSVEEKPAM